MFFWASVMATHWVQAPCAARAGCKICTRWVLIGSCSRWRGSCHSHKRMTSSSDPLPTPWPQNPVPVLSLSSSSSFSLSFHPFLQSFLLFLLLSFVGLSCKCSCWPPILVVLRSLPKSNKHSWSSSSPSLSVCVSRGEPCCGIFLFFPFLFPQILRVLIRGISTSPTALLSCFFSTLLGFSTSDLAYKTFYHNVFAHSSTHCTVALQANDVMHQFRQVHLPQSNKKQSKPGLQRCSSWHGQYKVVTLASQSARDQEEVGSGSFQRSLAPPEVPEWSPLPSPWFWTFVAEGSVLKVRHQPSMRSSDGSLLRLLKFFQVCKKASQLALLCCAKHFFSQKDRDRCGPPSTLALFSWLSGMSDFSQSSWRSFFIHPASFLSSAILKSFEELCRSTRRACSHAKATLCCRHC